MTKIKLKIPPETLFLLQKITLTYKQIQGKDKTGKIAQSIREELFEKLSRSCITYTGNPNGKARELTLRYYLANQIYNDILFTLEQRVFGFYEANKLEILKNELHQKLL